MPRTLSKLYNLSLEQVIENVNPQKEPGIPNTTKLTNSFARVYKFLFIIILLYRKTIYIGLFKQILLSLRIF